MLKILFFLLSCLCFTAIAKRDFILIGTKVVCVYNSTWIESSHCYIENRNNRTYGFFHFVSKASLPKFVLRGVLDIKAQNLKRTNLLNIRVDICPFLDGIRGSKLFDLGIKYVRKFVNPVPKCPIIAHQNYTVSNFYFDEEDLPSNTPTGNFYISIYQYQDEYVTNRFDFYGKIAKKQ